MSILPEIDYYTFSLLLGGVIALLSGVSVYLKGEKIPQNLAWLWLNISTAVWSFGYFTMVVTDIHGYALIGNWILHSGAIFIPFFYFMFIIHITGKYQTHKKYLYVGSVFLISFLFLNTTTLFVKGVISKYPFKYAPDAGPLYVYFTIYFFVYVVFAISTLLLKIPKTHGEEASRLRYILWSSVAGFIGGGSVFFLTFNINIPPYLLIMFSVYPIIIAYAILRHNLFNIKLILVELGILLLNLFLFLNIFISRGTTNMFFNASIFIAILLFSFILMRGIYKDIKNRERIEELAFEVGVSNEKLRIMEGQKTEFVSIASHQLRTPLTVIKGYASMILEGTFGPLNDKARDAMERLYQSSDRIVALVEDLLTVSRIEQGRITLSFESVNLSSYMREIFAQESAMIGQSGLSVSFTSDVSGQFWSPIDVKKFKQVIKHILENAIKYTTAPGTIDVNIFEDKATRKNRIAISDTGIGMSQKHIRETFERLNLKIEEQQTLNTEDNSTTEYNELGEKVNEGSQDKKTSGIGLYIAQEIIRAHQGALRIESAGHNRGTTFIIELPRATDSGSGV